MKFRSLVLGLAGVSALASLSSCKPVRSEQIKSTGKEPGALSEKVVSDLKLGFYLAEEGSTIPNFERPAPSKLMEGKIQDGQVIQLKKRVPIGQEKLFLAISDVMGNQRIIDASYEFHSISKSNSTRGDAHRALLSYDWDQHLFYLSMNELLQDREKGISGLDLQILKLILKMNDGSTLNLELRFYAESLLPSAEQIRVSQVFHEVKMARAEGAARISAQPMASKEGWSIVTELYQNPTSRSFFLWFTSAGISYQLETELGLKLDWKAGDVTIVPAFRPPTDRGFEPDLHRFSVAPLERVGLILKDIKDGKSQTVSLSRERPTPVEILPGQTLEVDWQVMAAESVPPCKDGEPASRTFWACDTTTPGETFSRKPWPACKRPADGPYRANLDPFAVQGTWEVKEYRIVGEFKSKVQVTEDVSSRADALSLRSSKSFAGLAAIVEKYSCQGIF